MKNIILASESPRRSEILKSLGLDFEIISSNIHEISIFKKPSYFVKDISNQKAQSVKNQINYNSIIIAADTVVFCNKQIIGKPQSYDDAKRILSIITNNPQCVYTGFTVIDLYRKKEYIDYEKTKVIMDIIPDHMIDKTIKDNFDKAGCYAIQSNDNFVKRITGDYYNVLGLPLLKIVKVLKDCDVTLDDKIVSNILSFGLIENKNKQ